MSDSSSVVTTPAGGPVYVPTAVEHDRFVCQTRVDPSTKMAALACNLLRQFPLILCNRLTEFVKSWQEASTQHPVQILRFQPCQTTVMAALGYDWRYLQPLNGPCLWIVKTICNRLTEFVKSWQEASTQHSVKKFVFINLVSQQRLSPWHLIGLDIFGFSFAAAEWNLTKLDRETRIQLPPPSFIFSGQLVNKDGCPGLWLAEAFFTCSPAIA